MANDCSGMLQDEEDPGRDMRSVMHPSNADAMAVPKKTTSRRQTDRVAGPQIAVRIQQLRRLQQLRRWCIRGLGERCNLATNGGYGCRIFRRVRGPGAAHNGHPVQ